MNKLQENFDNFDQVFYAENKGRSTKQAASFSKELKST